MPEVKVTSGSHKGHVHYECDVCNQYFETDNSLDDHRVKLHPNEYFERPKGAGDEGVKVHAKKTTRRV